MDAYFILADQHAQAVLHDVAFSALPNAPVLPYVEPRHRVRRLVSSVRRIADHRPRPAVKRPARASDCRPL